MERLIKLLNSCCPDIDFSKETYLITEKVIDSIELVTIISELEREYSIVIPMEAVDSDHFDSPERILELVSTLKGNETLS